LAALAGVAQEVQRQTSFTYRAGLWIEDMHLGLLWSVGGRGQKPSEYRAPSWSWVALDIQHHWGQNLNLISNSTITREIVREVSTTVKKTRYSLTARWTQLVGTSCLGNCSEGVFGFVVIALCVRCGTESQRHIEIRIGGRFGPISETAYR
jgi:hypothetical protein